MVKPRELKQGEGSGDERGAGEMREAVLHLRRSLTRGEVWRVLCVDEGNERDLVEASLDVSGGERRRRARLLAPSARSQHSQCAAEQSAREESGSRAVQHRRQRRTREE
eukprot:scaffold190611_cov30-Tisochrysis_lutea.AAC.1